MKPNVKTSTRSLFNSLLFTLFATQHIYHPHHLASSVFIKSDERTMFYLGFNFSFLSFYKKYLSTNLPGENIHHFRLRNAKVRDQFLSRRETAKNACVSRLNVPRNLSLSGDSRLSMFTLEPRKKLAFCRTAKHGSSTLSNVLLQLLTRT